MSPSNYVPTKVFFTKGIGKHQDEMISLELALRNAQIEDFIYNKFDESGIFPPACKQIYKDDGLKQLKKGQVIDCIFVKEQTNEPNRLIAVSIGLAIPSYNGGVQECGYILGYNKEGMNADEIGDYVEDRAATNLASKLGLEFDLDTAWNEREQYFKASGKIFKTSNYTQSAEGDKNGLWTSVLVAAIYLP